jgi:TP901 family phage tail tape measure protein
MNAMLDARFTRVFNDATNRINDLERQIRNLDNVGRNGGFGKGIISSITKIGKAATTAIGIGAGAAIAGGILAGGVAIKNSIEKAMDFESQIKSIQSLTGASDTEMTKMQALALKMGAATKYNAMESATAIENLLKAGLTPAAVQAGGLEAALNLATAGGLDLAEAADTMATSMNGFKKDGMTAATVSNILAGTANTAATNVHELAYALASGGSVADMAGLSFKDFNTAIGLMSNDGLKSGSDAGTSFKSMLMYLQPQTKQATKLFNQLGIGVGKANKFFNKGKIKDIAGIAKVMHDAFDGMDEQTRTDKMMEMFGTDAVKAASSLFKAGAEGVEKFQKSMSNVTALDVAKKKMNTAAGAVEQFSGAIETLQISALMPTMPIIQKLATGAADAVTKYTPQITASMERMVDRAENYVKTHFTENPDFQRLKTIESQVNFVFDDVKDTFNTWWDSSGQAEFERSADKITKTILGVLENSVPQMAEIGSKMGLSIADGMLDGMRKSKSMGWIFKVQDFATPAIADGSFFWDPSNTWKGGKEGNGWTDVWDKITFWNNGKENPASSGSNAAKTAAQITQYATGGYVTRPELAWVGEGKDPEWIIPQNNSARSRDLWESAGRSIGAMPSGRGNNGSSGNFVFSPVYNFNGPADQAAVQQMEQRTRQDFKDQLSDYEARERRLSFG